MNRTNLLLSTALLAAAIAGTPMAGWAQGQAQPPAPQAQGADKSSEDHKEHHPTDATTAQAMPGTTTPAPAPSVPGQGGAGQAPAMGMMGSGTGMMGGDMGAMMQRMMPMMRGMMAQRSMERMDGPMGMMAPRRVEGASPSCAPSCRSPRRKPPPGLPLPTCSVRKPAAWKRCTAG